MLDMQPIITHFAGWCIAISDQQKLQSRMTKMLRCCQVTAHRKVRVAVVLRESSFICHESEEERLSQVQLPLESLLFVISGQQRHNLHSHDY